MKIRKQELQIIGFMIIILGLLYVYASNPVMLMIYKAETPIGSVSGQTETPFESFVITLSIAFVIICIGIAILIYATKKVKK